MTDEQDVHEGDPSDIYGTRARGGQFYRRPGARLTEPQDKSVINLSGGGIPDDMHEAFHAFDTAHVVMLAEQGIIPEDAAVDILRAFRSMEADSVPEIRGESEHSAHAGEAYLIDELGESVGGYIHAGRSSHDLGATAVRLVLRERVLDLLEACLELLNVYAETADTYKDAVMPTYTGIQHAQVATFGFCLMGWERAIERDFERLMGLYDRVNASPAGAAVGTTTDFPIDRQRVAELLGFSDVLDNAEDIDKSFDLALEAGTVLATLMANLGQAADTLLLWYSKEFDLVDMPDRFCGTSSIMPQKKNPHTIQSVQRDTNGIIGDVMNLFVGTKNIGGGARPSLETFETATTAVRTWTNLIANIEFDTNRGEQLIYRDWALATDLASALVRDADIPWRTAHQIVAILVRRSVEENLVCTAITAEEIEAAGNDYLGESLGIDESTVEDALNARRALDARADVPGSPAPSQVTTQIEETHEFIRAGRATLENHQNALETADSQLTTAVDELLS